MLARQLRARHSLSQLMPLLGLLASVVQLISEGCLRLLPTSDTETRSESGRATRVSSLHLFTAASAEPLVVLGDVLSGSGVPAPPNGYPRPGDTLLRGNPETGKGTRGASDGVEGGGVRAHRWQPPLWPLHDSVRIHPIASGLPRRLPRQQTSKLASSQGSTSIPTTSACYADLDICFWPGLFLHSAGRLKYHNGRLLTKNITVYPIWYGSWPKNSGQNVVYNFLKSLSSPAADKLGPSVRKWWHIVAAYKDKSGARISPTLTVGKSTSVGGNYKKVLGDFQDSQNDVKGVVLKMTSSGQLPLDANGVYVVFTSADVTVGRSSSNFCGAYCGWHDKAKSGSTNFQYAFVGHTDQCPEGCNGFAHNSFSKSPSGFYGVDGSISILAHELAEAASNPDTCSGYWAADSLAPGCISGWENADLCAWTFEDDSYSIQRVPSGGYGYNLNGVSGTKFLVQLLPNVSQQACILQAGTPGSNQPPLSLPSRAGVLLLLRENCSLGRTASAQWERKRPELWRLTWTQNA